MAGPGGEPLPDQLLGAVQVNVPHALRVIPFQEIPGRGEDEIEPIELGPTTVATKKLICARRPVCVPRARRIC